MDFGLDLVPWCHSESDAGWCDVHASPIALQDAVVSWFRLSAFGFSGFRTSASISALAALASTLPFLRQPFHHLKIAASMNRIWVRRTLDCISRLPMKWERKVVEKWGNRNFDVSFNVRSLFRRWCSSSVRTPASRGVTEFGWSYTGWMLELHRTKVTIPLSFYWVCFEVALHNMHI